MIDKILLLAFVGFFFKMTAVSSCLVVCRVRNSPSTARPVSRVRVMEQSKVRGAWPFPHWITPYTCRWVV